LQRRKVISKIAVEKGGNEEDSIYRRVSTRYDSPKERCLLGRRGKIITMGSGWVESARRQVGKRNLP